MSRVRRSSVELRALLLKAAEEVFERQGYVATTTRDLAREAGVSESVLYHHFPTKAALFRESVLEPLVNVLEAFSAASSRYVEYRLDDRSMLQLVLSELFDQLSLHRSALRSFTAAEDDLNPDDRAELHDAMSRVLGRIGAIAQAEGDRRGFGDPAPRPDLTTRLVAGMFVSLVVHDAWVLPRGDERPRRAEVIDHLTDLILRGLRATDG